MTSENPNSTDTGNPRNILSVLLALLVILNAIGFSIYHHSQSSEAVSAQLWNYLDSDLFELVTISLLLPIMVLVLESHFKFIQSLLEDRLKRGEAIRAEQRALVERQRQERVDGRLEAIAATQQSISQLFDLAIQVQYFHVDDVGKAPSKDPKPSEGDEVSTIVDLLRAAEELSVSANTTVNMWSSRLRISPEDEELFLYFINIVLYCTADVARCIDEADDEEEIAVLQAALGIIWTKIKEVSHQSTITILKKSKSILDLKEATGPEDELKQIASEISQIREPLRSWHRYLKGLEQSRQEVLPDISGRDVDALHEYVGKAREYLKEHPGNDFHQFEGSRDLEDSYYRITRESRFSALNRGYSKEFIKLLADKLGYEILVQTLLADQRKS